MPCQHASFFAHSVKCNWKLTILHRRDFMKNVQFLSPQFSTFTRRTTNKTMYKWRTMYVWINKSVKWCNYNNKAHYYPPLLSLTSDLVLTLMLCPAWMAGYLSHNSEPPFGKIGKIPLYSYRCHRKMEIISHLIILSLFPINTKAKVRCLYRSMTQHSSPVAVHPPLTCVAIQPSVSL